MLKITFKFIVFQYVKSKMFNPYQVVVPKKYVAKSKYQRNSCDDKEMVLRPGNTNDYWLAKTGRDNWIKEP